MPEPTQAHRRIAIETPLGADVLLVRRCVVREQINRPFQIDVDLKSKENDINFDEIIGKNVTVRVTPADETRYFNGYVARFVQTKSEGNYSMYRATIVPWLWFLTRSADCRIFQETMEQPPDAMTVPGILKKVFKDHGFEEHFRDDGLSGSFRTREFCVQYRETAFNFVSRLMEQEGIAYFFEHSNGAHKLVLVNSPNGHNPMPGYETVEYDPHAQDKSDREVITDWIAEKEVQPGSYVLNDFNFENPRQGLQHGLVATAGIARAHDLAELEIYDYPGDYPTQADGEDVALLRIQELQARHEVLRGQGTTPGLSAGFKVKLSRHPRQDQNRECLATSVTYEFDEGSFETGGGGGDGGKKSAHRFLSCQFTAIPADQPFRPPRVTPKPQIQGPQTAIVVGPSGEEIHTDKYGRIKAQFHWDRYGKGDDNASCWIRVSQTAAGKGWGSVALPRVGHEVIVEFLDGDPDRPIVTGQVYNSDLMPPYALPGAATRTLLKSSSSKGGDGFNELRFEDKKGEEQIFLHGEKDVDVRLKNDSKEFVGHDRHLVVKNDQLEKVGNDRHETIVRDHIEKVGRDHNLMIEGKDAIEITGSHTLKVKDDVIEVFQKNHHEEVTNDLFIKADNICIEGKTNVTIKVGGSHIAIESGGIKIGTSGEIKVESSSSTSVKASGPLKLESSATAELKGTTTSVKGDAAVQVQAAAVKIN